MINILPMLKEQEGYEWLKDIDSQVSQQTITRLDISYQNFFRRVKQGLCSPGFPKFKNKYQSKQSFEMLIDNINKSYHCTFVRWVQSHGASCV